MSAQDVVIHSLALIYLLTTDIVPDYGQSGFKKVDSCHTLLHVKRWTPNSNFQRERQMFWKKITSWTKNVWYVYWAQFMTDEIY